MTCCFIYCNKNAEKTIILFSIIKFTYCKKHYLIIEDIIKRLKVRGVKMIAFHKERKKELLKIVRLVS